MKIYNHTAIVTPPATHRYEKGQILLIVVLLMVVILTITLSLAARSIVNQRSATDEDNSERAFSAAEAGIQMALTSERSIKKINRTQFSNGSTFQAEVRELSARQFAVNNGNPVLKNDSIDVWLSNYPDFSTPWSGDLSIYWGDPDNGEDCNEYAAFEIAILSGSVAAPTLAHYAYDICGSRSQSNNFTNIGSVSTTNPDYQYVLQLPRITNGILMRIIPLYTNTTVAIETPDTQQPLPIQGKIVEAVGNSGGTQRKIVVFQGNPKIPLEMFPYVLFTPAL